MKNILDIEVHNVGDIELNDYFPDPNPIQEKKKSPVYNKDFFTFDIETTAIKEIQQSFMYIWQFYTGDVCLIGRTWAEFRDLMQFISKRYVGMKAVIYVHFLSHEFQYFSGIYKFNNADIFAIEPRKILKCVMLENIEFRCSYLLSNMSLGEYTKKMKVAHPKLKGDLDYSVIRTHATQLTDTELAYCVNDVVGLHEAITKEMEVEGDTIATIPLTSTGYVRRDARAAMAKYKRTLIDKIYPDYYIYTIERQAFRGGNCHASRFYTGTILEDLQSDDIKSSYPGSIGAFKYPMSEFKLLEGETDLDYYIEHGYACLAVIVMENVRLRDELWPIPYIPIDKCRGVTNKVVDNGRILSSDMLEITVTDIDYNIIMEEYVCDTVVVKDLAIAQYGDLPPELKGICIKYFTKKTELDGIEHMKVYYTKAKNKLNANFGMMVQCPVKEEYAYIEGEWKPVENDESEQLREYGKTAFLPYQWGVWVTAWSRWALEQGIKKAGYNTVYVDTDCVKHLGDLDLSSYNMDRLIDAENNGFYAKAPNGEMKYMGLYEKEEGYKRFITWGAKKYAGEQEDGLHITIAGVNKEQGAKELERRGGLEALKPGFVFKDSAGAEFVYNDTNYGWYKVNGEDIYITRNLYSYDSTYKLSITAEYEDIIKKSRLILENFFKNY